MSQDNGWIQYANIIIPIGISLIGVVISHYVSKEKVKHLEEAVKDIKADAKEVRDKVISCETSLKERAEPLTKRKSPVSLTERGVVFLKNSGGEKFVDENFQELLNKVEVKKALTAFDIQEVSKDVISTLKDDQRLIPLKEFLFKDGSTLDDLFTVMGIYLRDKILAHKKIGVQDVDRDDPSKKM